MTTNALGIAYLREHGVDLAVATECGVTWDDTYVDWPADGYSRRRFLTGRRAGEVMPVRDGRTISGVSVEPWMPIAIDGWLLLLEGESDTLAAISALYELIDLSDDDEDPDVELCRRDDLPPPLREAVPVGLPGAGVCHGDIVALAQKHVCDVVVLLDGDSPGRAAAQRLAQKCREAGVAVTVADPGDDRDLCDVLAAAGDPVEVLAELVAEADAAVEDIPVEGDVGDEEKPKKPPQSQIILGLAREAGITCWATPTGEPYATMPVDGHVEHHRLGSRASRDFLARLYYLREEKAPSAQALQDALGVLRGDALWGGSERVEVHVRHAAHGDSIYVDLGDADWRAIEIDGEGWRIVTDPPVRFRRPRGMLPLPEPVAGGNLDGLRELLNVDDEGWTLVVGVLVGMLAPTGPYPVASFLGEHGAAKSSAARQIRGLVDPNVAPLRSEPRDEHDLVIAASNGRVVALDNVSRLSPTLSDGLCRISTGGGYGTRELYSDGDEVLFSETRPVVMTSIAEVATRGDLLDRSILVTLHPIPEAERLTEAQLEKRRQGIAPMALGGLLDAASTALRRRGEVHLERLPRMADHAIWVEAAAPALGWAPGKYIEVYDQMKAAASETALEASPLTDPIRGLAKSGFSGTATEMLEALEGLVEEKTLKAKTWPKAANSLTAQLRRLAADLRVEGIAVEDDRLGHDRRRVWRIERVAQSSSASSASSASPEIPQQTAESDPGSADGLFDADCPADGLPHGHRPHANGFSKPDSASADDADDASQAHSDRTATDDEEAEVERLAAKLGSTP